MIRQTMVCNGCKTEAPVEAPLTGSVYMPQTVGLPTDWAHVNVVRIVEAPPGATSQFLKNLRDLEGRLPEGFTEMMESYAVAASPVMTAPTGQLQQLGAHLCPECARTKLAWLLQICASEG